MYDLIDRIAGLDMGQRGMSGRQCHVSTPPVFQVSFSLATPGASIHDTTARRRDAPVTAPL